MHWQPMSPKEIKSDIIYEIKKPLHGKQSGFFYSARIRILFLSTSITPPLISKN